MNLHFAYYCYLHERKNNTMIYLFSIGCLTIIAVNYLMEVMDYIHELIFLNSSYSFSLQILRDKIYLITLETLCIILHIE